MTEHDQPTFPAPETTAPSTTAAPAGIARPPRNAQGLVAIFLMSMLVLLLALLVLAIIQAT